MNFLSISDTSSGSGGPVSTSDASGSGGRKHGPTIDEDVDIEGIASGDVKARRRLFGDKEKRKGVEMKGKEVGMEFANGLLGEFRDSRGVVHTHRLEHMSGLAMLHPSNRSGCSRQPRYQSPWSSPPKANIRLQHPLRTPPTAVYTVHTPLEILGWPTRHICMSEERSTRGTRLLQCGVRDCR